MRRDVMQPVPLAVPPSRHRALSSEMTLTTNGTLLERYAAELAGPAACDGINVSIDSLDPDRFRAITRRGDLAQVLRGLDAAQRAGLEVKINAVALKGVNEDEIAPMIAWAHGRGDGHDADRGHAARRDRARTHRAVPAAFRSCASVLAERYTLTDVARAHRRPRALRAGRGDRRQARLHHAVSPTISAKAATASG